jgi:phage tail-like protein
MGATENPYAACRFYLQIGGVAQAVFTEASSLQLETDVFTYEEGGSNEFVHKFPGRTKVSNLTLKRGVTKSNELFKWFLEIARGKINRRNVSLVMYDSKGEQLMQWTLMQAYPVKWIGPQLTAASNTIAIESLELAHDGLAPS